MNSSTRAFPPALAVALFLIFRFIAAFWLNEGDGVMVYLRYSNMIRADSLAGLHRNANPPIEYPPLSIALMFAVGHLADRLPASGDELYLVVRIIPPPRHLSPRLCSPIT